MSGVVDEAATARGLTSDSFGHLITEDYQRAALFVQVAEAAWWTVEQAKLRALAAVLADGVRDDARLEISWLVARALRDIEVPHLRVLEVFRQEESSPEPSHDDRVRSLDVNDVAEQLPELAEGINALIAPLEAAGCIRRGGGFIGRTSALSITTFGSAVLDYIRAANEPK